MNFEKKRNLECVSRGKKREYNAVYMLINMCIPPLCVYTKSTYYLLL